MDVLLRRSPFILFGIVLVVFLVLLVRYQRKPEILSVDRFTVNAGDLLVLEGRFFGSDSDAGKLYLGSQPIGVTGIREWTSQTIVARVPAVNGAVLVRVRTRSGESNGIIVADARRFPDPDKEDNIKIQSGESLPGAPRIVQIEPATISPGTLVTLLGTGFGVQTADSGIYSEQAGQAVASETQPGDLIHTVELWSHDRIQFFMPQSGSVLSENGVGGGIQGRNQNFSYLSVVNAGKSSNKIRVEHHGATAITEAGKSVQWTILQEVSLDRIGAFPGNSLYLTLPNPEPGPGQSSFSIIDSVDSRQPGPLRSSPGASVYQVNNLETGTSWSVSRTVLVSTRDLRYTPVPGNFRPHNALNPELAGSLGSQLWIQPGTVRQTALRVAGSGTSWDRARRLYNFLVQSVDWTPQSAVTENSAVLSAGEADSRGFSLLFCALARAAGIPARPVAGILISREQTSQTWWWAEFWLEGTGWIPVDPALAASGIDPAGNTDLTPADYYFGGMDFRHIAFSRGTKQGGLLREHTEQRIPDMPYSYQQTWEEVSGNLESYRSLWNAPKVLNMYKVN